MKILVVEDDADVRESMVEGLRYHGHEVLSTPYGKHAIAIARAEEDIDVVFSDVGLPDVNGWTVAKMIRKRTDAPIYLITGWSNLAEGPGRPWVTRVLTKPVGLKDLLALVPSQ